MLRVTLRSFWEHKRRLTSTVVAIVLGVAFMCGTFVLSDTLDKVFDDLFAEANQNVDTQVQGRVLFSDPFQGDQRALLDPALVDEVARVDGVAAVVGSAGTVGFGSTNRVLGADGEPLGSDQGPPTLLESWFQDRSLSSYVVDEGRGPEADDEMALNLAAIEQGDLELGDQVTVITQFGRRQYTLVGSILFGTAKSSAGAVSAEFTLAEAQRLAGTEGQLQNVLARADDGVSQEELTARIAAVLPDGVEAITGQAAAAQLSASVQSGFSFFKTLLSVFGAIALLVGVFVISNTFSILVAQRTRELALLRAVGAGRGQVLRSVLVEASLVGFVAAVLGLLAGVALAQGVTSLLEATGADLPTTSLQIRPFTVVLALVLGLAVTLVAALVPAIRATRVPPLAALRDVALDRSGASRLRQALGVLVLLAGAISLSAAWTDGSSDSIPTVGLGAALLILGTIVIGPVLASPAVRAIGSPLPRFKGVTGKLATQNAARAPKRTSATASALVIGVTLVGFITILASSAKTSIDEVVNRGFAGDFVIQSSAGSFGPPSGFPSVVADQAAAVDGVDVVVPTGFGRAQITYPDGDTATTFLTSIEPERADEVMRVRMVEGRVRDLRDDGIIVDTELAASHDIGVGDTIGLTVPGGGSIDLQVQGISDDENILGWFTITRDTYASLVPELLDAQVFGTVEPGADVDEVIASVEQAIAGTPSLSVLDRDGFAGDLAAQITSFLTVVYGLLILSIVIALIGIANTLSLSINERTRELGLLRAVGMHRAQVRSAVRWEAVLISLLGTLIGLGLSLLVSWGLITAFGSQGLSRFSVPGGPLLVIVVFGALLGTAASILPSRRAARLSVLDAIATE